MSSASTKRLRKSWPPKYQGKGGRVWAISSTPSVSRSARLEAIRLVEHGTQGGIERRVPAEPAHADDDQGTRRAFEERHELPRHVDDALQLADGPPAIGRVLRREVEEVVAGEQVGAVDRQVEVQRLAQEVRDAEVEVLVAEVELEEVRVGERRPARGRRGSAPGCPTAA